MGLILDSSVLITAEREGQNARQILAAISGKAGNTEIAISVVTLIELAHGAARADTPQRKVKRQQFIQELLMALPIHPVNVSVALRTGQIDGENQAKGIRLPLSDLLIGVTALEFGYSVATGNLRHFQMIPVCGSSASSRGANYRTMCHKTECSEIPSGRRRHAASGKNVTLNTS
jgi:predicted nucleic acid-binding protein